jgi:hypothetical protein
MRHKGFYKNAAYAVQQQVARWVALPAVPHQHLLSCCHSSEVEAASLARWQLQVKRFTTFEPQLANLLQGG